jgi:hypothetical protein
MLLILHAVNEITKGISRHFVLNKIGHTHENSWNV